MANTGINFVALKHLVKQEGQRGLSEALNKAHFPQYSVIDNAYTQVIQQYKSYPSITLPVLHRPSLLNPLDPTDFHPVCGISP